MHKINVDRVQYSLGMLHTATQSVGALIKVGAIAAFATTVAVAQDAPENLQVQSSGENSITLTWDPSSGTGGVDYYRVRVTEPNGNRYTERANLPAPPYTVGGLNANAEYQFEVRTQYNTIGNSEYCSPVSGSTGGGGAVNTPPSVPGNLQAESATQTTIALTWDASIDDGSISNYDIRTNGGAPMDVGNVTSYTVTGLTAGTSYDFEIRATDDEGANSAYSPVSTASTDAAAVNAPPSVPQNLSALSATETSITLAWDASIDTDGTVEGYRVRRVGGSSVDVAGDATSLTITGLTADTAYDFDIRATDDDGANSTYSPALTASTEAGEVNTAAPAIELLQPLGGVFDVGDPIDVVVEASDADGDLDLVYLRLVRNGDPGSEVFEELDWLGGASYGHVLENLTAGNYALYVFASDLEGSVSTDATSFIVEDEAVGGSLITFPANGANFAAGDVEVRVTAPAGTQSVQFSINGFMVEEDVTSPYRYTFRNLQGGSYVISAVAIDGGSTVEDVIEFSVTPEARSGQYNLRRLNGNKAIVTQKMFEELGATHRTDFNDYEHENMNGPSVIRVPDFIPLNRRPADWANYYMYFAHHRGRYIRMAYAENVDGPYYLYNVGADIDVQDAGVLSLGYHTNPDRADFEWSTEIGNNITLYREVASPDVHVDFERQQIILYFHAPVAVNGSGSEQRTFVALSPFGLDFNEGIVPQIITKYYAAPFVWENYVYTFENSGKLSRTFNPLPWDPWVPVPGEKNNGEGILSRDGARPINHYEGGQVRHIKPWVDGDDLYIFHSTMDDTPEQIYYGVVDMSANSYNRWRAGPRMELATPEAGWEGGHLPLEPSKPSAVKERVNQLRDPEIFEDDDGKLYIFYAGGGEQEIGVSELIWID